MFRDEFGVITDLAVKAAFEENTEEQRRLLKLIKIEVNNIEHGFRNGGEKPVDQREADMRWVIDMLGKRHPGVGFVWEAKYPHIIKVGDTGFVVNYDPIAEATKNSFYPTYAEEEADRRFRLVHAYERGMGITPRLL